MSLPPDHSLYTDTIQKFLRVYRYLRSYSRQMQMEGLSGRKISALRYLMDGGPRTMGQISDYMNISDSSASELIADLKGKGLVSRRRSEEDNRVVLVEATAAGRSIAEQTPLGGVPLLREVFKTLSDERLERINHAMTDIMSLLEIDHEQ